MGRTGGLPRRLGADGVGGIAPDGDPDVAVAAVERAVPHVERDEPEAAGAHERGHVVPVREPGGAIAAFGADGLRPTRTPTVNVVVGRVLAELDDAAGAFGELFAAQQVGRIILAEFSSLVGEEEFERFLGHLLPVELVLREPIACHSTLLLPNFARMSEVMAILLTAIQLFGKFSKQLDNREIFLKKKGLQDCSVRPCNLRFLQLFLLLLASSREYQDFLFLPILMWTSATSSWSKCPGSGPADCQRQWSETSPIPADDQIRQKADAMPSRRPACRQLLGASCLTLRFWQYSGPWPVLGCNTDSPRSVLLLYHILRILSRVIDKISKKAPFCRAFLYSVFML